MEMNQAQEYVLSEIVTQIKMGFKSIERITEYITEIIKYDELEGEVNVNWATQQIENEFAKHMNLAIKKWGYPTDPYLLSDAFDELRSLGIIAIHNAGFTTSDGEADVIEIEDALKEHNIKSEGYCFYHKQDLQRALDRNNPELCLAFQKVDNEDETVTAKIGQTIVDVLRKNKLNAKWSGNVREKISISPILWNKVFEEDDVKNFDFWQSYYIILDKYSS